MSKPKKARVKWFGPRKPPAGVSAADMELLIALVKERLVIGKGDDGGELEAAVLVAALTKRLGGAEALERLVGALEDLAEAYNEPAEPDHTYWPDVKLRQPMWVGGPQIGTPAPGSSPYIPPVAPHTGDPNQTWVPNTVTPGTVPGPTTWTITCDNQNQVQQAGSFIKRIRM